MHAPATSIVDSELIPAGLAASAARPAPRAWPAGAWPAGWAWPQRPLPGCRQRWPPRGRCAKAGAAAAQTHSPPARAKGAQAPAEARRSQMATLYAHGIRPKIATLRAEKAKCCSGSAASCFQRTEGSMIDNISEGQLLHLLLVYDMRFLWVPIRYPEPHLHDPIKVVHAASKLLAVLAVKGPPVRHGPEHPAQLNAVGPPECPPDHVAC